MHRIKKLYFKEFISELNKLKIERIQIYTNSNIVSGTLGFEDVEIHSNSQIVFNFGNNACINIFKEQIKDIQQEFGFNFIRYSIRIDMCTLYVDVFLKGV